MTKKTVQLTPQGFEKIKEELRYLVEVKRQQIADNMGTAIADGDLRESAAYDEARMEQSANEARIADLEEIIHRAVVVEAKAGEAEVARLGASLVLEDEGGERVTYQLVGTHEADILDNRISDESPLGRELLGKRSGDRVNFTMGRNEVRYTVVAVNLE
jgi:transcription elongation factor GreA